MSDLNIAPKESGITLFHVMVIALSLMLTIGAWQYSKYQINNRTAARFDEARESTVGLLKDRMTKYEDALWAGVAAVESHGGDIGLDAWRVFAHSLRIEEKYPGINGIGFIHYITPKTLGEYIALRRQERGEFRIHPAHENPEFMPISFIEPVDLNQAAVGLDVAHEANRRAAALASRDTGLAQITGPIVLVQDSGSTPGFLFYAPLYDGPSATADQRHKNFVGAVYAPFVVRKLMEGLLATDLRDVRFSIRDAGEVIYDEHSAPDALHDPDPMYSANISLDLYGRTWTVDLRSNLAFRASNTYAQPTVILIAGLLIEALIITLLILMSRSNKHAVAYANKVTEDLRRESDLLAEANNALQCTNEELEQFVYVTSHDLKTPIRGINMLSEMIEEDLEDYFVSPAANPDVKDNLAKIQDRVARMNDMTRGVAEFSRVDADHASNTPICLSDIVAALRADFDLDDTQLSLRSDIATVHRDTFNFRRVVENLVGNAIKYHDGGTPIRISLSVQNQGDRIGVSVQDNGPGIDPRYHDKIFDFFQTLGPRNGIESTGIGLAIVRKSVKRNGGTVRVRSAAGDGATFAFDWPANAEIQDASPFRKVG